MISDEEKCECCGLFRLECFCPVHEDECNSQYHTSPTNVRVEMTEQQYNSCVDLINYLWEEERKDSLAVEGLGARHIWYAIKDLGEAINHQPWRKK